MSLRRQCVQVTSQQNLWHRSHEFHCTRDAERKSALPHSNDKGGALFQYPASSKIHHVIPASMHYLCLVCSWLRLSSRCSSLTAAVLSSAASSALTDLRLVFASALLPDAQLQCSTPSRSSAMQGGPDAWGRGEAGLRMAS